MLAICAIFMVANVSAQDNYNATTMGEIVRYYETAKWGQGSPFNNQCWTDATQQTHAKTGCVPTAFAIIMRHHGFPAEGIGDLLNQQTGEQFTDRTYDYSKMPLTNASGWTTEQQNEVAKLMAHLGHAFGVTFGQGTTSVSIGNTMSERMQKFFNYNYAPVSNQYAGSGQMYDFEEWKKNLKNSLDNGCPVPYAADNKKDGKNDTRHMFVIDGYTENEYFHFNFGWGGGSNGWYKLDDITPTGDDYSWRTTSDGYDSKHQAFFNLMPNTTTYAVTATVNDSNKGTVSINNGTAGSTATANLMQGITATLTAHPAEGYALASWTKNGEIVGTKNTLQVKVGTSDNEYVANFDDEANVLVEKDCTFTISDVEKSDVNGAYCSTWTTADGIILSTTKDSEKAYALSGSVNTLFAKGTVGNSETLVTDITYTLTAPTGYIIKAYSFNCKSANNRYTIDVNVGGNTTNVTYASATVISASDINAKSTSFVLSSTYNSGRPGLSIPNGITVTIQSEGGSSTPTTYTIAVTAGEGGTATVKGNSSATVTEGESVTLAATAANGYIFTGWYKGAEKVSGDANYTFSPTESASYEARFVAKAVSNCNIPTDNTLRYYRFAIAIAPNSYTTDFGSNYENVKQFWQECEDFMNEVYVPLGMCFDVVIDQRLLLGTNLPDNNGLPNVTGVTDLINNAIGSGSYDVGLCISHRGEWEENTGLSDVNGAYSSTRKANGYAQADKWVVAHEAGHLFGADHTTEGESSLMDNIGEFFSYPSIKKIRDASVSNGPSNAYKSEVVANNAPTFTAQMKNTYRIPRGACLSIPVYASDADGHSLRYAAIGCSSSEVGNITGGGTKPHFASLKPQTSNIIDYRPKFVADGDSYYLPVDGTNIPSMSAGSYSIAILVNDMPEGNSYDYLNSNPFYSNYDVWDATVEIVDGTSFTASISPAQNSYTAGSDVTVTWGVNNSVFTEDSRVRITMSTDYGKTFSHVLADDVRALDGSKAVTLPNVNVGNVDVDFSTQYVSAVRSMRAGIIRVEVIDGAAYTLTTLSPENGGGFNITGGGAEPDPTPITYAITTAANPAEGGTAKFSVGTGSQQTQGNVNSGELITLYAVANDGYKFVNWTLNGTEVSTEANCNVTASLAADYVANFEAEEQTEQFPDGAYKIYWQADNRGYLAYHATDYPNEAKLAGVTYSGCQDIHYAVNEVDLVWYLITADDDKRYLFQAATGKFLGVDTSIQANGTGNKLSTTEAWPIAIEENTKHTGHYIITTEINGTNNLLCSGCGTPKEQHPVRWLTVDDTNQTDGGAPLQLIPVNDVTVADNVMNAVLAVINGTDEPEQPTDPLAGKYFRLKEKSTGTYMNIYDNSNHGTEARGGVNVTTKNESNDAQIFQFIESGTNYKLLSKTGYYIYCQSWNVDAYSTTSANGTELTFEPTATELEYLINCAKGYFKIGPVDQNPSLGNFVYCDAAKGAAATWVLEEVIPSNEKTLNVTYSGATWNNEASGWWVSVVTNTTPAVTVKTTDGTPKIGYSTVNSVRHPYLLDGNSFTISVPANCKITGYRLGYQAHNLVSKSVTYTNGKQSTGTLTIAQSDEQNTLTVTGLDNNEISFSVEDQTTQAGFIIKSLEITYVENEFEPAMFKAEIEGWRNDNPNTHLGTITIGGTAMKLTPEHLNASELTMPVVEGTTLAFTRKYRGFEFNGFYIGATELGTNPTLTADNVAAIDENNPLIAKFTATDDVTLFYDDDEFSYRIPAIAKTGNGMLVAVSDYRHNLDDIGRDNHGTGTKRIDLVMRTSTDNGATWSETKTIAAGDNSKEGSYLRAFGDAAIAAVGQNIVVMAAAGDVVYTAGTTSSPNKMARIYSSDNGDTWAIEEMTTKMYSQSTSLIPSGGSAFFGSGKLAVDPNFNGTGNARIYGALLVRIGTDGYNNFGVFSDDLGATWKILGGDNTNPVAKGDEPKVEILPNGQILLSARRGGGRVFRVFTYGDDKANGAGSWGDAAVNGCDNGGSNATNGEIICLDAKRPNGKPTKILLQSQPKGGSGQYDRKDVTIWYKEVSADETYTSATIASGWTMGKQVSTVQSSYSAMALQANGEIALFFEEAPCYADDYTKGYSMVYVPLTIEEITNNNFLNSNADVEYVPVEFNIELTDTEGNIYRETLDYVPNNAAAVATYLTTTYPFITLGENGAIADNTYTNTVTLPFKVSNANTTVWHNIYFPANGTSAGEYYPIYLMAENENATAVAKITEKVHYGNSQYNTYNYADKLAWAVYNVNEGFTFKFKNKLTGKFMAVTGVSSDNTNNVVYTDEAGATAFTLEKYTGGNASYGNYAIKSVYNSTTGYVCNTSVGYTYATNYPGTGHPGAWVKFVESPDYWTIYNQLIADIDNFGAGEGKYTANDAISSIDKDALATMPINSLNTKAEEVQNVKESYREITLTVPVVNDVVPGSVSIAGEPVNNKFVPGNTEIELLATANAGYVFKNWTRTTPQATAAARTGVARATEVVSTDNPYRVTVSDALSLTANFEQTAMAAMTAILTDDEGNTYRHQFDELPGDAAAIKAALEAAYPFITLGADGVIENNTYKNTVKLPFRVSNNETTVWHNIYWPANGTSAGEFYPIYLMANAGEATYVAKITEKQQYSYSQYNTLEYVEELGWAVYSVDNTLTFKFKNRLTEKFMAVDGIVNSGNANNVIYTDEANATVFTLTKNPGTNNNWKGDWAITSVYNSTTGYICNTSAGHPNATNYTGNNHPGAWVKFVEAAEESSINDLRIALNLFGEGALYVINNDVQEIITALDSPNNIILNTLVQYGVVLDDAMTNWKTLTLTVNDAMGSVTINNESRKTKKAPSGFEFTVVATPANGYRFTHWSNGTTNVSSEASYTFNMPDAATELTANFEEVSAAYPEVTGNTNANNYLTSVTTEGGRTNVNYSANTHPGEKVVTIGTVQIGRGESFSMNLIAYSLGEGSTSAVREDMRYCHASLFTDFDGDRTFQTDAVQHWGVKGPSGTNPYAGGNSHVYGNYDLVMNITANITVPVDAPLGESHVRMIYTNAWKDWPTNGTTTLDKGIVYDIIVEVVEDVENVTITVGVATENTGTVTIDGEGVDSKQVAKDSEVTVVATPASGYHFVNWTDAGGNVVSTNATYTFTASENTSLVANFEADVVYHTITVSTYYNNNGGTVKVGEEDATSVNVAEGESVRMLATVADGYEFMGWLKDGVIVKNAIDGGLDFEVQGPDYTLYEIKASAEYVAVFSKITETTGLEDGKAYRICGVQGNGRARCIYRDGNTLKWKYDYDNNDVNTIFVAQKNGNAMNLISAVGYHGWKASNMLGNDEQYNPYAAIKVTYGTRDELRTLYIESGTSSGLFQTNTDGAFSFQNSRGGGLTMIATDEATTDFLFEEVDTYAFQVSAADGSNAKLGTVNLPFATTVPAGVTVYGVNYSNEDYVYVAPLELTDNVLPANTPVLIEAAASGKYGFKPAPASANVYETGFAGTLEAEEIPGTTNAYILSYKGVGTPIKMYKLSSTDRTINANKAYFIDSTGKASALQFVFGGTTDIDDVEREDLEDTIYDLQGRKLSEITEPGMYIINGKKVYKK